jgi:hypothetical protein
MKSLKLAGAAMDCGVSSAIYPSPPPIFFAQNPAFKEFSLVPSKTQLFGSSRVPDSISTSILEDRGKLIGTFRGGCKAKRWKSLERFDDARGLDSVENGE